MYFGRRDSIKEMKRVLLESDELARDGTFRWKSAEGCGFTESLPELVGSGADVAPGQLFQQT